MHVIPIAGSTRWTWNGDTARPTIDPSILARSGHYASAWKEGDPCWCGKNLGYTCGICHSYVTDGRIQFLTDSTHALRGQTVDLPEYPQP